MICKNTKNRIKFNSNSSKHISNIYFNSILLKNKDYHIKSNISIKDNHQTTLSSNGFDNKIFILNHLFSVEPSKDYVENEILHKNNETINQTHILNRIFYKNEDISISSQSFIFSLLFENLILKKVVLTLSNDMNQILDYNIYSFIVLDESFIKRHVFVLEYYEEYDNDNENNKEENLNRVYLRKAVAVTSKYEVYTIMTDILDYSIKEYNEYKENKVKSLEGNSTEEHFKINVIQYLIAFFQCLFTYNKVDSIGNRREGHSYDSYDYKIREFNTNFNKKLENNTSFISIIDEKKNILKKNQKEYKKIVTFCTDNLYNLTESIKSNHILESISEIHQSCDLDLSILLKFFSSKDLTLVFASILLESKLFLIYDDISVINKIINSFLYLIFPFKWNYPLVSFISSSSCLSEFFEAPFASILGVSIENKENLLLTILKIQDEAVIFDLSKRKFEYYNIFNCQNEDSFDLSFFEELMSDVNEIRQSYFKLIENDQSEMMRVWKEFAFDEEDHEKNNIFKDIFNKEINDNIQVNEYSQYSRFNNNYYIKKDKSSLKSRQSDSNHRLYNKMYSMRLQSSFIKFILTKLVFKIRKSLFLSKILSSNEMNIKTYFNMNKFLRRDNKGCNFDFLKNFSETMMFNEYINEYVLYLRLKYMKKSVDFIDVCYELYKRHPRMLNSYLKQEISKSLYKIYSKFSIFNKKHYQINKKEVSYYNSIIKNRDLDLNATKSKISIDNSGIDIYIYENSSDNNKKNPDSKSISHKTTEDEDNFDTKRKIRMFQRVYIDYCLYKNILDLSIDHIDHKLSFKTSNQSITLIPIERKDCKISTSLPKLRYKSINNRMNRELNKGKHENKNELNGRVVNIVSLVNKLNSEKENSIPKEGSIIKSNIFLPTKKNNRDNKEMIDLTCLISRDIQKNKGNYISNEESGCGYGSGYVYGNRYEKFSVSPFKIKPHNLDVDESTIKAKVVSVNLTNLGGKEGMILKKNTIKQSHIIKKKSNPIITGSNTEERKDILNFKSKNMICNRSNQVNFIRGDDDYKVDFDEN